MYNPSLKTLITKSTWQWQELELKYNFPEPGETQANRNILGRSFSKLLEVLCYP